MATKLEGGVGGKALVARPLVEELFFFAASLKKIEGIWLMTDMTPGPAAGVS